MEENKTENLIELTPDIAAQSSRKEALCIHNVRGNNSDIIQYNRNELHALRYTNHGRNTSHVLSPVTCLRVIDLCLNKRRKMGRKGDKRQLGAKSAKKLRC